LIYFYNISPGPVRSDPHVYSGDSVPLCW